MEKIVATYLLLLSLPSFIGFAIAAPQEIEASLALLSTEPILDDGIGVKGEMVLGNPVGDRVVYKFYDTNCGYCRAEYRRYCQRKPGLKQGIPCPNLAS